MTLDHRYQRLRTAINSCLGWRVLDDDEVIREGDRTTRASSLGGKFDEGWHSVNKPDLRSFIGRTVRDMNDPNHNPEMDVTERLFCRRISK